MVPGANLFLKMLSASYISKEIGELLAKSYKDCIGKGVKVTAEMAQTVLKPALHNIMWLKSTPPTRAGTAKTYKTLKNNSSDISRYV